ncbi:MAG: HAMP domain-containing histidine kinase [Lachnospiraceae bacterium]|nr:HAMP domain-containing histidine kinase [Lachnospiraceae bacterium]
MQEKKVKRKRPMAAWARWFLKLTQHVSAGVAMLALAALILTSTVYIEDFNYRRWINSDIRDDKVAGTYLIQNLNGETEEAIRLAIIRSQLETGGVFDGKRLVNVSEYYYRKNANRYNNIQQYTYFSGAVYYLEDLIRWQQAGGLRWMDEKVENRFLTVDGKRLEEIVHTEADFKTLCDQLIACMSDLSNNYDEYQRYMKQYKEGQTSFVYYIDLDNETGDIYTNASFLKGAGSTKAQDYFGGLVCAAMGTTALNYSVQGDYEIDVDNVADFMSKYDYAMGDNAIVYTGFDMSLGANDYYATLWKAMDSYNMDQVYMLLGIVIGCSLYYLLVTLYMLVASGRKVDKTGEEFIELKWVDGIYLEVFLAWCTGLGFAIVWAFCELYEFYLHSRANYIRETGAVVIGTLTFLLSVLLIESLCSFSRRVKSRTFLKNSLIYKFCISQVVRLFKYLERKAHNLKEKAQYYIERSGLWEKTWGLFLIEIVFYAGCLFLICLFMTNYKEDMAVLVAVVMLMSVVFLAYRRLKRRVEREEIIEKIEGIVAGESSRVSVEHLSIENAALGRAVNEIGEGIQQAVETSIKDERLKAELLTNVSHDIKTPLTSIISYVDLLKKEQIENERAMEYIEVLESKSLKLKNLIQDLIEVSKISTGNIEYEMMPLNLHELIMQAAGEYDERFAEHCLKLVYNNHAKEACIMADSRRMWRVMENLLSNVYKYALEGTRVYLEVLKSGENLIFTMKNISAKELNIQAEELSERFVQGDLSRSTEGSGLGLAIAQNLIIGQGGEFKVLLDGDLFKVQIIFSIYEKNLKIL